MTGPVHVIRLDDGDAPSVVYVPSPSSSGVSEERLAAVLEPVIEQVETNTADIEYLKTTGGGTPTDPFVDWFQGDGPPPTVIPGAARGDMYFDKTDRRLYQLS